MDDDVAVSLPWLHRVECLEEVGLRVQRKSRTSPDDDRNFDCDISARTCVKDWTQRTLPQSSVMREIRPDQPLRLPRTLAHGAIMG